MGETIIPRSLIGSEFELTLVKEFKVGSHSAVIVTVSGRSWIFGLHQIGLDPDDPFAEGFMLADTWGPNVQF